MRLQIVLIIVQAVLAGQFFKPYRLQKYTLQLSKKLAGEEPKMAYGLSRKIFHYYFEHH